MLISSLTKKKCRWTENYYLDIYSLFWVEKEMEKMKDLYVCKESDWLWEVFLVGSLFYTNRFKVKDGKEHYYVLSKFIIVNIGFAVELMKMEAFAIVKWIVFSK